MGKSEILNALAAHKITVHGEKVFMCKPEEQNAMTYKLLVGKVAGKIFHDPNRDFDEEAFIEAEKMIGDSVAMLNLYQHVSWDNIKQDILTAAGEGYRTVYLDPITCFTNTVSSAEANELLVRIASEAAAMAHDHKLSMWLFCHLNAPGKDKKPHESGGKVLSSQFAGSRAMMRACHTMWGLQGDKSPDLTPEERNLRQLVLLEDRNYGQTGKLDLYWDSQTGLFEEV
jgi:twinkle protein